MKWTPQEEAILRKMAEKGLVAAEIAKVLRSRSVEAISQKSSHMGISLAGDKPQIDLDAFSELTGEVIEG